MGVMLKSAIILCLAAACLGGCNRALFPKDAARSPYDRYLALRGETRPKTTTDAYGKERPALRERLAPLDDR